MKKYLPAIFALGAPVVFVIGVIIYVLFFTPSVSSEYDFIMADRYNHVLFVKNNRIEVDEKKVDNLLESSSNNFYSVDDIELWYYSVEDDSFEEIELEEAQQLVIDGSEKSPDGFKVEYVYSRDLINIFGIRSQRGHYIRKDNKGRRLDIDKYRMDFIGWVIN